MLTTSSPTMIGPADGESVTLQTIGVRFMIAGADPARILEIISPAGFEKFFAELAPLSLGGAPDPEAFGELCGRYALDMQPDSVPGLCARFGVWFPGVE